MPFDVREFTHPFQKDGGSAGCLPTADFNRFLQAGMNDLHSME